MDISRPPSIIQRLGACNFELIINNSRNYGRARAAALDGETRERESRGGSSAGGGEEGLVARWGK